MAQHRVQRSGRARFGLVTRQSSLVPAFTLGRGRKLVLGRAERHGSQDVRTSYRGLTCREVKSSMCKKSGLLVTSVLIASLFTASALAAKSNKDDVRKAVVGFSTDWNHHDMEAFGKLFTTDADFVNVIGIWMKGRREIQMHHAWAHGAIPESTRVAGTKRRLYGIFRNSTMKFNQVDVRMLQSDVAIAHVRWELLGDSRTTNPRRGILTFVLTRQQGGWLIAAAQNTEINRSVK